MAYKKSFIYAVCPYAFQGKPSFKQQPYDAWVNVGGKIATPHYPAKIFHGLAYKCDFPSIGKRKGEAQLRFVEPVSLTFDTFPDYIRYEIIPMIWDCWPRYVDSMARWFKKHQVHTAFFTSSQTAEKMRRLCPQVNIFHLPEAIETELYHAGKKLSERSIDYLEFGRCSRILNSSRFDKSIKVLSSRNEKTGLSTRAQLADALADSKITLALTRLDNQPELAEGIDTLTQRYWECMLSGVVILGRAPQELIDIIGYDPVVHLDLNHANDQILDILEHIDEYQKLVDKNREMALKHGDWKQRIHQMMEVLEKLGYKCK